jgi:DNA repair exonuclease SbcCD nuclease subunit
MDYQLKSKVTAKQLQLRKFERAFAGHLHRQQETSGVWYPGSLIAINFGEPELGKGFLHVTDKGVKPVEVPYPKFMTLEAPEKINDKWIAATKKKLSDNIVRIVTPTAIDAAIIKDLEDANPRLLQIKLERATSLSVESLKTAGSKTLGALVKSYVEQRQVPDELKQRYIDYGIEKLEVSA